MADNLLSEKTVRAAKPDPAKEYKMGDGKGMYLLVKPNGTKCWRLRYTCPKTGKERSVAEKINSSLVGSDAGDSDKPQGLAYGAQTVSSSGSTVAQITTDLRAMIDKFVTAHASLDGAVWIVSPQAGALMRLLEIADADGTLAGFCAAHLGDRNRHGAPGRRVLSCLCLRPGLDPRVATCRHHAIAHGRRDGQSLGAKQGRAAG